MALALARLELGHLGLPALWVPEGPLALAPFTSSPSLFFTVRVLSQWSTGRHRLGLEEGAAEYQQEGDLPHGQGSRLQGGMGQVALQRRARYLGAFERKGTQVNIAIMKWDIKGQQGTADHRSGRCRRPHQRLPGH